MGTWASNIISNLWCIISLIGITWYTYDWVYLLVCPRCRSGLFVMCSRAEESRAEQPERDPRKRKIWVCLNFSACIFLSPFFANFYYFRWLILFARCRTEQSRLLGNVRLLGTQEKGRFELLWTYLSFACIFFVTNFCFFIAI